MSVSRPPLGKGTSVDSPAMLVHERKESGAQIDARGNPIFDILARRSTGDAIEIGFGLGDRRERHGAHSAQRL